MGVSSIFGLAQSVSDQAAGSPLFPGGPEVLVIKKALGGQPKSGFVPGGTHWNGYDAKLTDSAGPKIAALETRWMHFVNAQGEREVELARQNAETASGVTDWQTVVPLALSDAIVTSGRRSRPRTAARRQIAMTTAITLTPADMRVATTCTTTCRCK